MTTECNQSSFEFHSLNQRKVIAKFDGGDITSDAGILLLREVEKRTGLIARLGAVFYAITGMRGGSSTRLRSCWHSGCLECVWATKI